MQLPAILREENVKPATELLRRYYLERDKKSGQLSTGSYFDAWAGGGDHPDVRNRIVDSDAVAVSMLSVTVPAQAIIGLQKPELAEHVSNLLAKIPTDVKLSALSRDEATTLFDKGSHAVQLWEVLRRTRETRWDVGATIASKILARKRPHLIPIWDTVIGAVVGKRSSKDQWLNWHKLFLDDPNLSDRLERILKFSTVPQDLSELRIMDAVLWRYGKDQGIVGGHGSKAALAQGARASGRRTASRSVTSTVKRNQPQRRISEHR
jgi:hypothetical protein